jgi:hypothetical protein
MPNPSDSNDPILYYVSFTKTELEAPLHIEQTSTPIPPLVTVVE